MKSMQFSVLLDVSGGGSGPTMLLEEIIEELLGPLINR